MKHPGSAGLTAERFGDAEPYSPPRTRDDERHMKGEEGIKGGGDNEV